MNCPDVNSVHNIKFLRKLNVKYRIDLDTLKNTLKQKKNLIKLKLQHIKQIDDRDWTKKHKDKVHCPHGILMDHSMKCSKCPGNTISRIRRKYYYDYKFLKEEVEIMEDQLIEIKKYINDINSRIRVCQRYSSTKCMCCLSKKKTLVKGCVNSHMFCEECMEDMCADGDSCKICETSIINRFCDICNDFKDNFVTDICENKHNMCLTCLYSMFTVDEDATCPFCRSEIIGFED